MFTLNYFSSKLNVASLVETNLSKTVKRRNLRRYAAVQKSSGASSRTRLRTGRLLGVWMVLAWLSPSLPPIHTFSLWRPAFPVSPHMLQVFTMPVQGVSFDEQPPANPNSKFPGNCKRWSQSLFPSPVWLSCDQKDGVGHTLGRQPLKKKRGLWA